MKDVFYKWEFSGGMNCLKNSARDYREGAKFSCRVTGTFLYIFELEIYITILRAVFFYNSLFACACGVQYFKMS